MPNWITVNKHIGRFIIRSVLTLIAQGTPERIALYQVARHFGQNQESLNKVFAKVKARMQEKGIWEPPPAFRFPQKCPYCGLPQLRYRNPPALMIPICDWRGEIVGAHIECERLEQLLAGGL